MSVLSQKTSKMSIPFSKSIHFPCVFHTFFQNVLIFLMFFNVFWSFGRPLAASQEGPGRAPKRVHFGSLWGPKKVCFPLVFKAKWRNPCAGTESEVRTCGATIRLEAELMLWFGSVHVGRIQQAMQPENASIKE